MRPCNRLDRIVKLLDHFITVSVLDHLIPEFLSILKSFFQTITKGDSFIRAITPISFDYKDTIYNYEKEFILKVAKKDPCVILGRCAGEILLEENIECLNVFLYADEIHRAKRVREIPGTDDPNTILRTMKKKSHSREAYYTYYTGKRLGELKNWHMSLDTVRWDTTPVSI